MNYAAEALESMEMARRRLEIAIKNPDIRPHVRIDEVKQWATDLRGLRRSTPFYWNDRTVDLVTKAGQDFNLDDITCSRHILEVDCAWHWFADKAPFDIELFHESTGLQMVEPRRLPVKAITWYWGTDSSFTSFLGMAAWCLLPGPTELHLLPVLWACVDAGQPMSSQHDLSTTTFVGHFDDTTTDEIVILKRFVVAASTFMRQRLLSLQTTPLERHARKRIERAGGIVRDVQVVHLRRLERKTGPAGENATEPVEWNWQWTVRGHTRQQYYPSLGEHLPVYIHPYVKGPEDKPLKPRTTPIMAVVR